VIFILKIISRNKSINLGFIRSRQLEFYDEDLDFVYLTHCDALAEEDWGAPKHRNKATIRTRLIQRR